LTESTRRPEHDVDRLAQLAQDGCAISFDELVRYLQAPLLHFLKRVTGNHADAQDLLQDTFLRAYEQIARYDASRCFRTWLFTIGYRLALNARRRKRSWAGAVTLAQASSDPGLVAPPPDDPLVRAEQRHALWDIARRHLTDKQFACLWLHCVEDMAPAQIGQVTGQSPVTVRVTTMRARQKLRPHFVAAGFSSNRTPVSAARVQASI
jgi:RNA polymerase sigma-70 factor (ECF subfamily)